MKSIIIRSLILFCIILNFSCKEEPEIIKVETGENNGECRMGSIDEKYISCMDAPDVNTLDVATWNIKFFPTNGEITLNAVKDVIKNFQADVIAVQEISDISEFRQLIDELPNWEGQYVEAGNLSLGFLYNTCEIVSISDIKALEIGSFSAFPRLPVELTISHQNGIDATLINIHLKCCNNGEERRGEASILLKEYIDETYPEENVILLGDYNDDIKSGSPFENFINDNSNYLFADTEIAYGPVSNYSYPGWPSHIDHILVTNELIDNIIGTQVVAINKCYSNYYDAVSDHRPVILSLKEDQ